MAVPTITFNAGTGSDTAASGAGPATALTGTAASYVTTTVTLDGSPDLSGVATDSSALLWLKTSTGRQYFKITAVDNTLKTVTVHVAPTGTSTGRTWGIGGKRATLDHADSRLLINADWMPGWTISLEDNQSISSALAPTVAGDNSTGPVVVKSSVAGTRRTITQTANAAHFSMASANNNSYTWKDLNFANSNGTKTSANAFNWSAGGGGSQRFINCSTDATNKCRTFQNRSSSAIPYMVFIGCDISNCTAEGLNLTSSSQTLFFYNCLIHDNGGPGLVINSGYTLVVIGCVFDTNTGDGLLILSDGTWDSGGAGQPKIVAGNTFYANTGDGFDFSSSGVFASGLVHINNIYMSNGNFGARGMTTSDALTAVNDFNDYYTNTSGARSNLSAGTNDLTLDPQFTDAPNGDFRIGTNLKALGFPVVNIGAGSTRSYVDIGAAQRAEAAAEASYQMGLV